LNHVTPDQIVNQFIRRACLIILWASCAFCLGVTTGVVLYDGWSHDAAMMLACAAVGPAMAAGIATHFPLVRPDAQ
jgi:hypothetical protein